MISYETFKEYVKEELILRLPPEFAHCRLAEDVIYKVNCRLDALRVMPQEAEKKALAVPVLYYRDFYSADRKRRITGAGIVTHCGDYCETYASGGICTIGGGAASAHPQR